MKSRNLFALALLAAAPLSQAAWTVTILHPPGAILSNVVGFAPGRQYGEGMFAGAVQLAGYWTGTPGSWVSLNPSFATNSFMDDAVGNMQVGGVQTNSGIFAGYWSGTAASWKYLNPAGVSDSMCMGTDGIKQVGYVYKDGVTRASLWSSTVASWVDLSPAGASESYAYAVSGTKQAGDAKIGTNWCASLWLGSKNSWVNLNPAGADVSRAYAMTSTRQGGYARIGGKFRGGMWSGTAASWVDLTPAGFDGSALNAMNDTLQVGNVTVGTAYHACYWTGTAASMVDLHNLLPPGYIGSDANAVWSDGVNDYIGGSASKAETYEAVIWSRPSEILFELTLNKATVAGQNSVQGTITLPSSYGSNITFTTYDNSSLVTTPASVTVTAGTTVKNFQITVTAVTSPINTTIYAKRGAITHSQPLTLAPLIPTSVSFTPNPVTGGQTTTGKVVINGVAGPGGRTIALFDNSTFATTPSSVTVPSGASQVTFPIPTLPVTAQKVVTVTARVSAGEKTGTFRINP